MTHTSYLGSTKLGLCVFDSVYPEFHCMMKCDAPYNGENPANTCYKLTAYLHLLGAYHPPVAAWRDNTATCFRRMEGSPARGRASQHCACSEQDKNVRALHSLTGVEAVRDCRGKPKQVPDEMHAGKPGGTERTQANPQAQARTSQEDHSSVRDCTRRPCTTLPRFSAAGAGPALQSDHSRPDPALMHQPTPP